MTFKITSRTYPQPDSPESHIGPRERAMAVFKYLLDIEPEDATKHPLFECIKHAFEQEHYKGAEAEECLTDSLVPLRRTGD